MLIKFNLLANGPGPSEAVVGIRTIDGQEEVILSKRLMHGEGVEIGTPLLHEDDKLLVELPRESAAGRWRIWVPKSEAIKAPELHPAE
ncbi:hypothetical protein [Microvirga sp. Mcv34]|uniref:hypothetical protein n=1 Tax=Microvirga sp. Mcv34 TaxID=2926016 RepID=UPI0021C90135|nr:hypothetical protein [Microvirga sp. Mcv34]